MPPYKSGMDFPFCFGFSGRTTLENACEMRHDFVDNLIVHSVKSSHSRNPGIVHLEGVGFRKVRVHMNVVPRNTINTNGGAEN